MGRRGGDFGVGWCALVCLVGWSVVRVGTGASLVSGLPGCCESYNSTGYALSVEACSCSSGVLRSLGGENGTGVSGLLSAGGGGPSPVFHWRVQDFLAVDAPDGSKRSVHFEVQTCRGSASLHVNPLRTPDDETEFAHSSTAPYSSNALTLSLLRAHFFLQVRGEGAEGGAWVDFPKDSGQDAVARRREEVGVGEEGSGAQEWAPTFADVAEYRPGDTQGSQGESLFLLGAFFADEPWLASRPVPGGNGSLTVEQLPVTALTSSSPPQKMRITFQTAVSDQTLEYRLYRAVNRSSSADPCSEEGVPGACVRATPCGVMAAYAPVSEWEQVESDGRKHSFEAADLVDGESYSFQVLVRPAGEEKNPFMYEAYTAEEASPHFERVMQLHSNEVLMYVGIGVAGLIFVAVIVLMVLRVRMARTMETHTVDRRSLLVAGRKVAEREARKEAEREEVRSRRSSQISRQSRASLVAAGAMFSSLNRARSGSVQSRSRSGSTSREHSGESGEGRASGGSGGSGGGGLIDDGDGLNKTARSYVPPSLPQDHGDTVLARARSTPSPPPSPPAHIFPGSLSMSAASPQGASLHLPPIIPTASSHDPSPDLATPTRAQVPPTATPNAPANLFEEDAE